jgi:hypothetical protein
MSEALVHGCRCRPTYGGIENVVAALVPELWTGGPRSAGHGARSTLLADECLTSFPDGRFEVLPRPDNQVSGVGHAHVHAVLRALRGADPGGWADRDVRECREQAARQFSRP